ncbi:MAG: folylpolyglutamate synthase/dihydrofolate synthase family protein [Pyrinomonadaceae bacterium]
MNFDQSLAYLLSLGHETLAMKLGLENIERLLKALGNPQKEFASVQIAGTNGKGSTAIVLDSICRNANIDTGLYTSPHLVSITERIRINGREIETEHFARLTAQVKQTAEILVQANHLQTLPTFFEHVTAMALLAFREAGVRLAILETGLGGRLDATTVARADTIALTPIAMDHQEYLGQTLGEIAAEKAAIIRSNVTAIIAPQLPEAMAVITARCNEVGVTPGPAACAADIIASTKDGRFTVNFKTQSESYECVRLGLRGRHQIANVALAISLAEALSDRGFVIPREAIVEGIERARHPGRLEIIEGNPHIFFDGAHNPAAAATLREYLNDFIKAPLTLVFGAMRDKSLGEMLRMLAPTADKVILTTFDNPRAASAETLAGEMPPGFPAGKVTLAASAGEALDQAFKQTPSGGFVCITGSLYLVGEMQKLLSRSHQ